MRVNPIQDGVVLDHLPANTALSILQLLNMRSHTDVVTIGINLPSKSGVKDLIKIEQKQFSHEELQKIAIFAPLATINIIENTNVIKKEHVAPPKHITGAFECPNPSCITNNEHLQTQYDIKGQKIKCIYCERSYKLEELLP